MDSQTNNFKWLEKWQRPGTIAKILFFIGIMVIIAVPAWMSRKRGNIIAQHQKKWCAEKGGTNNVALDEGLVCPCLTDEYAVVFVSADSWDNALGPALNYAGKSEKAPGIVLVLPRESDKAYEKQLRDTLKQFNLPVRVWTIEK